MAKLTMDENSALFRGYEEGERVQRAHGKAHYNNPHPWASPLWEGFEFGYYLQEKGLRLPYPGDWEKRRGKRFQNSDGFTYRLHYGKGKNSFGISRES